MSDVSAAPLDGGAAEHWLQRWWRPAMAWQAFAVGLCDFIVFPMINGVLYAAYNKPYVEWHPLSLQGGGMYWIAMGAIVGVTSWQRSQEKMASFGGFGGGGFGGGMMSAETDSMSAMPSTAPRAPLTKNPRSAG